jgi:hypothetical protein
VNAFAMAEAARDLRRGGAGGEGNGVAFGDHIGGGDCNAALFIGEAFFAEREGSVEAEGFVGQFAGEFDTAVSAVDQATLLEFDEIPPDTGGRGVNDCSEIVDAAGALLQEQVKNVICAIMSLCSHLDQSFLKPT